MPGIAALLAARERYSNTWLGYALTAGVVSCCASPGSSARWPRWAWPWPWPWPAVVLLAARVDTGRIVGSIGGMLAGGGAALLW